MADEPRRSPVARLVRHFVLHPGALIAWLAALLAVVALVLLVPIVAPSIPVVSQFRGSSAPDATENYLRGNRDYNADLVWGSLNSEAQSRLKSRGGSLEDLQRQMEAARQQGIRLEEISYIGSKAFPDGTSMQFYLVGVRQQAQSDVNYQPYMFTLDRDGKIAKVQ